MTLGSLFDPRANSIGAMRLWCAAMVIVGHAFSYGGYMQDPLQTLTNNQLAVGRWPVDVFFTLSGFLLAMSYERTSLKTYALSRFLRIYPAYWVCLVVCGILTPLAFAADPDWSFVLRGIPLVLYIRQEIPGVFEGNFTQAVNGPLWTLPIELGCYLTLPLMALFRLFNRRGVLAAFAGLMALYWGQILSGAGISDNGAVGSPIRLATFFYAGVSLYMWRDNIPMRRSWVIASALILAAATWLGTAVLPKGAGLFYMTAPPFLSYITLYLAIHLGWTKMNSRTDISYGIYIYGTFNLQILTAVGLAVGAVSYPVYVLLAVAMTVPMAFLSWFAIERPALALKRAKVPRQTTVPDAAIPTRIR